MGAHYLFFLVLAPLLRLANGSRTPSWCPAIASCATKETEIQRWECVGDQLFGTSIQHERGYVYQSCHGVGWGNAIRGLYNAAALALMEGRRLMVHQ